jgi:hypothetical protein
MAAKRAAKNQVEDNDDHQVVRPGDPLTRRYRLWPQRHANYWLLVDRGPHGGRRMKTREDLYQELLTEEEEVDAEMRRLCSSRYRRLLTRPLSVPNAPTAELRPSEERWQ